MTAVYTYIASNTAKTLQGRSNKVVIIGYFCLCSSQIRPGRWFTNHFLRVRDAPPTVTSLLLLLAGDIETNPCPSCYACGQNFRHSDTHLTCHTPYAKFEPTKKPDEVVCPDLNSHYHDIAQPTVGPVHQLPLKRTTPDSAVTTRFGQAPELEQTFTLHYPGVLANVR